MRDYQALYGADNELALYGSDNEEAGYGHVTDQLNDLRRAALYALGIPLGQNNDMVLTWLHMNGATSDDLNDAWREMLNAQLDESLRTGQLNDDWYTLLGTLGFTGTINDREYGFWYAGGEFGDTSPTWFGLSATYYVYEIGDGLTIQLSEHCYGRPPEITYTSTVPTCDPNTGELVITWADIGSAPGANAVTVTATNTAGMGQTSFTVIGVAGEQDLPPQLVAGGVPDVFSTYGQIGVDPSIRAQSGLPMQDYFTSNTVPEYVPPGSVPPAFEMVPSSVAQIDPDTGVMTGKPSAAVNDYNLQAFARNSVGQSPTNWFLWQVLPADGWVVDFTSVDPDTLGGLTYTSTSETFYDYQAQPQTVGGSVPAMVGQEWDGSNYTQRGVSYGIQLTSADTALSGNFADLEGLPDGGVVNNFTFHVAGIWRQENALALDEYMALFLLANESGLGVGNGAGTIPVQAGNDGGTHYIYCPLNYIGVDFHGTARAPIQLNDGDLFAITCRKRDTEPEGEGSGLSMWVRINNGPLQGPFYGLDKNAGYIPVDCSAGFDDYPIDLVDLADQLTSNPERADTEFQKAQVVSYAMTDAEVEALPTWSEPTPVLDPSLPVDPPYLHFGEGEGPVDPPAPPPTGVDVVALFTDVIDAKRSGWSQAELQKGAAVAVYGIGFGTVGVEFDGTIDVGNRTIPWQHIIPIEAAPFPGMQVLTFHLDSEVQLGTRDIVITRGGTSTDPLPLFVRDDGRFRFFDASVVTGGDGSYEDPWRYPNDVQGYGRLFNPGDHVYFRNGTYTDAGGPSGNSGYVLNFYGDRAVLGCTSQLGLSFSAQPGHTPTLDSKTGNSEEKDNQAINFNTAWPDPDEGVGKLYDQLPQYHSFSKLNLVAWYGSVKLTSANNTRVVGNTCNGLHYNDQEFGAGDIGWSGQQGNNNLKILCNEISGGTSQSLKDHSIYPGGGGTVEPGNEIAYNYIHSENYGQGPLISMNYKDNDSSPDVPEELRRVATGEYVKGISVHHNLIDARHPEGSQDYIDGWRDHKAIVSQSLGDDRPDDWLPDTGQWAADPMYIYNNVIVMAGVANDPQPGNPGGPGPSNGISIGQGVQTSYILNNTIINSPLPTVDGSDVGAGIGSTSTNTYNSRTHQQMHVQGNIIQASGITCEYFQDRTPDAHTFTGQENCYWNGDGSTKIPGETGGIEADPGMTYDLDNLATVPMSLPAHSPCAGASSDPGVAAQTRDYNLVPYSSRFDIGAIQATSLIFSDSFDNHDDWASDGNGQGTVDDNTASFATNGDSLPAGYFAARHTPWWSPNGRISQQPTKHQKMYISSEHADKARGGAGKSLVHFREGQNTGPSVWGSDGILSWYAGDGVAYQELYVEFYIQYSESWISMITDQLRGPGTMKIFRMHHWDDSKPLSDFYSFHGEKGKATKPNLLWGTSTSDYGFRNKLSLRPYPSTSSAWGPDGSRRPSMPNGREINNGDWSGSWQSDLGGQAVGGGDPQLVDKKLRDQSYWVLNAAQTAQDNIFGSSAPGETAPAPDGKSYQWTKFAFYVKLNSEPGLADGKLMQWVDDERTVKVTDVIWVDEKEEDGSPAPHPSTRGINVVELGGNSYFEGIHGGGDPDWDNEQNGQYEDWVSYDDLLISTEIPAGLDD